MISGVIITLNEGRNIERCLASLNGIVDELIVVDSGSTDDTVKISLSFGAKVISHPFEGYKEQKNFAVSQASFDYVLSLDGDEAISEKLRDSLVAAKSNLVFDGYYFNRRNCYCGQWIRHSNWYPDRKLRLFNRTKASWGGINPHDRVIMNEGATTGRLQGDILHWVINSYEEHIDKVNRFSTIAAVEYFKLGKRKSVPGMILHTAWRFFKAYFLRLGILDGYNGFVISLLSAYTSMLKYIKLRKLVNDEKRGQKNRGLFNDNITHLL